MDYSEKMMSPNIQISVQCANECECEGQTATSKLFYKKELSYLIRHEVSNCKTICRSVGHGKIMF